MCLTVHRLSGCRIGVLGLSAGLHGSRSGLGLDKVRWIESDSIWTGEDSQEAETQKAASHGERSAHHALAAAGDEIEDALLLMAAHTTVRQEENLPPVPCSSNMQACQWSTPPHAASERVYSFARCQPLRLFVDTVPRYYYGRRSLRNTAAQQQRHTYMLRRDALEMASDLSSEVSHYTAYSIL